MRGWKGERQGMQAVGQAVLSQPHGALGVLSPFLLILPGRAEVPSVVMCEQPSGEHLEPAVRHLAGQQQGGQTEAGQAPVMSLLSKVSVHPACTPVCLPHGRVPAITPAPHDKGRGKGAASTP